MLSDKTFFFSWSMARAKAFSSLSGDWNPIHTDRAYARRTRYGHLIAHGIDLLLAALEQVIPSTANTGLSELVEVHIRFTAPLISQGVITVETESVDDDRVSIRILHDRTLLQHGHFKTQPRSGKTLEPYSNSYPFKQADNSERESELKYLSGIIPWRLDATLATELYPTLSKWLSNSQIAAFVVTSQCVGMRAPGARATLVSAHINFDSFVPQKQDCAFKVTRFDERYNILFGVLSGPGFTAKTQALLQPAPVKQDTMAQLSGRVPSAAFSGATVWVLGGSRGLGETVVKLTASGGAKVYFTYFLGKKDAKQICDDVGSRGGKCEALQLDLQAPLAIIRQQFKKLPKPTLVVNCATPSIQPSHPYNWSGKLFSEYLEFYVGGTSKIAQLLTAMFSGSPASIKLLIPSSKFIDDPPARFAEYTAAKVVGEIAVKALNSKNSLLHGMFVRLPPLITDQTVGLPKHELVNPADAMLPVLMGLVPLGQI